MSSRRAKTTTVLLSLGALLLLRGVGEDGGCGQGLDNKAGIPGINVGGVEGARWTVAYDDQVTVKIKNAAGVVTTKTFSWAAGGIFDMEGVQVDLRGLCEREDVACPNEVFPHEVVMTQPGTEQHLLYVTFSPEGPLGDLSQTTLVGNVDSEQDFSIALGIKAAALGTCGLLGVSYATGHILTEEEVNGGDPTLGFQMQGEIVTAYSGGCVIGNAAGGGTVELRVPFDAQRIK